MRGQVPEQPLLGEQYRRLGVGEHEGEPLRRIARVQRHIRASGLEDAQQSHDELQRTLHGNRHQHLRPYAQRTQVVRELVGPRIELGVGQPLLLEHHCCGLRRAPGLCLE